MFYSLVQLCVCVLVLSYVQYSQGEVSADRWSREFRVSEVASVHHSDFVGVHERLHTRLVSKADGQTRGHVSSVHSYGVLLVEDGDARVAQERHEKLRALAKQEGFEYKHMSNSAGLVTGDAREMSRVESLSFVEAVLPFTEEAKVHRELSCEGASEDEPVGVVFRTVGMEGKELGRLLDELEVLVGENGEVERRDFEFFKHGEDVSKRSRSGRVTKVKSESSCEEVVRVLSSLSRVTWVDEHHEKRVSNKFSRYTTQSGYQGSTTPIWNMGLTGSGQVVGVSDTGLDVKSCFFYDSSNSVPYDTVSDSHRKITTYITYVDSSDPDSGHGTHVCGSVMGNAGTDFDGMAYDAKVAFYDIGDSDQALYIPINFNKNLYQPMRDAGAYIMSGSWGSSTSAYNSDCYYSDQFMEDFEDSVVLYAAGNDGEDGAGSIGAPATAKNVIAVGAAVASDDSWSFYGSSSTTVDGNKVASFSSQGPTAAGLLKPDLTAPGYFIFSAYSDTNGTDNHCQYTWKAGTSMATPTAAGNLALIRQFFTDGYYTNPLNNDQADAFVPTGSLLKAMLIHSTVEMDYYLDASNQDIASTRGDYYQGYGQVQLDTVLSIDDSFDLIVWGAVDEVGQSDKVIEFTYVGQEVTFEFLMDSSGSMEFKVTMAYTDPVVGLTDASLSNDIDLTVTYDGSTYYPISGDGSVDSTNTIEQIVLSAPTAGSSVLVKLRCSQLNDGPQEASLVVSGLFSVENGLTVSPSIASSTGASLEPTTMAPSFTESTSSPTTLSPTTSAPTMAPSLTYDPTSTYNPTIQPPSNNKDDDSNLFLSVGLGIAAAVSVGSVAIFVWMKVKRSVPYKQFSG